MNVNYDFGGTVITQACYGFCLAEDRRGEVVSKMNLNRRPKCKDI